MASATKSGDNLSLTAQQEEVLRHIARYRLSFTEVIEHICFRGQSSRKTLENLVAGNKPLAETVGGFRGRRKAYILTKYGSKVISGGIERSKAPSNANINLLAFCCLSGRRRIRLEQPEIREFFGEPLPGRNLVMECSDSYCLHSVYTPGASTKDQTIIAKIEERFIELAEYSGSSWKPEPAIWLNNGKLRVTGIVETAEKAQRINEVLQRRLENIDHPAALNCSVIPTNSNRLEDLLCDLRPSRK